VTPQEATKLGSALPPRQPEGANLPLARSRDGAVLLVLYADDYRYDAGDEHQSTMLTAEKKLARDVADFVTHVVNAREGEAP
jgi:hypothetical protein